MTQHGRDLTIGSIPKQMLLFSLPMFLGSMLQTAYGFINAIWVGNFLGSASLAAVTVGFPVFFALIAVGAGLTLAANILIAQNYGAKQMKEVRRVADNALVLILGISILLAILGEFFAEAILVKMDTPPEVLPMAIPYLRITLLTIPFGFGHFLMRNMLQGIGNSKTPLYFQIVSVIATALLDPLLMFGWLGFPKLGLNGTAWAAFICQAISLFSLFYYLDKKQSLVAPRIRGLQLDLASMWLNVRIGIPSAIQQSLVSLGMVFVTGLVNHFGETATAAFGAASRIDQLAFLPAMTFSMSISTLAGQNIGAKKFDRVREVFMWGCLISGGFTLLASLIAVIFPEYLLGIFIREPEVVALGTSYLHIVGSGYILFAIMFVSNGIINGAGHTFVSTISTLISLWIVRIPLATYLTHKMGTVTGIWIAISLSFGVSMIISLSYYFSGRWKKAIKRHAPVKPMEMFGEETGEA